MDYEDQMLLKAGAFEELVRIKGWEYVLAFVTEQLESFQNKAITEGFKSLEDYQFYRGRVAGLKDLINEIETSLQHLQRWRDTNHNDSS